MKAYLPLSIFPAGDDLPIFTGTPDTFTKEAPIVAPLSPTHDQLAFEEAINEAHEASRKAGGEYEAMQVWSAYRPILEALRPS